MALIAGLVLLVIGVSATCSLFEAVLYSVSPAYAEALAARGSLAGRVLRKLRTEVERPIAAILALNTIANTAGAAAAGAAAEKVFGSAAIGWFSAGLTLAVLVFAEIVPKTAGVVHARRLAPLVAIPLQILVWAMSPLVWLSGVVARRVGGHGRAFEEVSDAELLALVRMAARSGAIERDEAAVIQNVLQLERKTVRDVMTPRTVVFSLPESATVEQAHRHPRFGEFSRIPLYADDDPGEIIGLVHKAAVLEQLAADRPQLPLRELMRPVRFVRDDVPLDRVLRQLLEVREHMLIVIDATGEFVGVITLEDVVEEILGREIVDETDRVADLRELARRRRAAAVRAGDQHWPRRDAGR